MGALVTLMCVTFGLPVAALYTAGYLVQHRRSRVDATLGASEHAMPAPHGAGTNARGVRCYEFKGCTLAKRDKCPAYDQAYLPCWLSLKLANRGQIERVCLDCVLHDPERMVGGIPPKAETSARGS
jgi:hypothetical protein